MTVKMKPSMSLMKMTIQLLLLMILFVLIFLISSLLYSARYWPDIYNYINANITIKRIPTLTELNLTIIEVDYVTESYSTTDVEYTDVSTDDGFDLEEFTLDEVEIKNRVKRSIFIEKPKDYIELPSRSIFIDYVFLEEPVTTVKDRTEDTTEVNKDMVAPETFVNSENENKQTMAGETTTIHTMFAEDNKKYSENLVTTEENGSDDNKEPNEYEIQVHINEIVNEDNEKGTDFATGREIDSYIESKRMLYQELIKHEIIDKNNVKHNVTNEGYLVEDDKNYEETTTSNKDEEIEYSNTIIIKDLVDESKLATRGLEDVETFTGRPGNMKMVLQKPELTCHGNATCTDFTTAVYPWVVAIFVKNATSDQFTYYCDGALVSDRVILTDARCVLASNTTVDPDDILVFLGKGSLQIMNGNEKIQKIKEIIVHDNFTTDGEAVNNLSLLVMEEPVVFTNTIQSACLRGNSGEDVEEAATTAWALQGELMPIFFNKERNDNCFDKDDNIFCATYGNHVALCPSYGGVYAVKSSNKWCLHGIYHGDPAERGICFTKNVYYTSLNKYLQWIDNVISDNKNYL